MIASSPSVRSRARGFTLTELAVVFTIVALLLASAMYTLSAQTENRNVADTQRRLDDAKDLLIAYAMANGRLPCPASGTTAGDESPTTATGVCTDGYTGFLPARVIGFTPVDTTGYGIDVWGNRIRYAVAVKTNAVDNTFTIPPASPSSGIKYNFNPTTTTTLMPTDLMVCASYGSSGNTTTAAPSCGVATDSPPGVAATNQFAVAAVVWSQGKNFGTAKFGGVSGQAGSDEAMNNKTATNANHGVFVAHAPRPFSETNEFDDQVVWIPASLLYAKMIAAGALP
jgi:prepilin-type N-terminal cleavage/methylation domain-containing protein